MQARVWFCKGGIAAILALLLTYFILEPVPTALSYGALLGWTGMIGVLVILVQGYRKMDTQLTVSDAASKIAGYELGLSRWGGMHTALSIAVTVLIAAHAIIFLPSLWEVSLAIWLGAAGFVVLLILNGSGLLTESKRKSRKFGSLKRLHVVLMLVVLAVSILHIELIVGPMFVRSIVGGAIITLVVLFVVFVSVPIQLPGTPR